MKYLAAVYYDRTTRFYTFNTKKNQISFREKILKKIPGAEVILSVDKIDIKENKKKKRKKKKVNNS